MATDYQDGENRIVGTTALSAIDSFNRNRARLEPHSPAKGFRQRYAVRLPSECLADIFSWASANSVEDVVRRGQRQVEQVKLKMSMQMDDRTFQSCLLETQVCSCYIVLFPSKFNSRHQVMTTKDHSKWNFDMLQELIEGPLLNPKRMEEAIKVSRFVRRLMTFFHPFSHRFSDMKRTRVRIF